MSFQTDIFARSSLLALGLLLVLGCADSADRDGPSEPAFGTGGVEATPAGGHSEATGGSSLSGVGGMNVLGGSGDGGSRVAGGTGGGAGSGQDTGGGASGGPLTGGTAGAGGGLVDGTGGAALDVPRTIWISGDSTVANGNTPCPTGWGKAFGERFNELISVENWAAGGRSVRTWLYVVTSTMGDDGECVVEKDGAGAAVLQSRWVDMQERMGPGDFLFVQFGINDGSPTCDRHVGLEKFKEEYAMMAAVARERGAQPVFLTPVSSIACSSDTAVGSRGAFVTATLDIGAELGVPVIDLHQRSVDLYNDLGFCPVPGGDVSSSTTGPVGEFFCDDHTHFSSNGAVSIGELVVSGIVDLDLALSGYLK